MDGLNYFILLVFNYNYLWSRTVIMFNLFRCDHCLRFTRMIVSGCKNHFQFINSGF